MTGRLTEDDIKLLKDKSFAHLATLMPDGSPQVSPVWVDVDADQGLIIVNTEEGRTKTANVRRDRRVALSVTSPDNAYRALMIRGRVVEDTHEGAADNIDDLSEKYMGQRPYPAHDPERSRVLLRIQPESISRMG